MPRPVWNGTISFGLVAIPVKLFHAVRRQSVSFNQLDDRTMARIKYKKVSALDGEEVPDDHIVKGYEVSKERYVIVDPDELEPFIPAATKTVDIEEFVDLVEIDPGWRSYGAGISLGGATVRAFRTLGVLDAFLAHGHAADGVRLCLPHGPQVAELPTPRPRRTLPASRCTKAFMPGSWARSSKPRPRSAWRGCSARRRWA